MYSGNRPEQEGVTAESQIHVGEKRVYRHRNWGFLALGLIWLAACLYGNMLALGWDIPQTWSRPMLFLFSIPGCYFVLRHLNERVIVSDEGLTCIDWLGRAQINGPWSELRSLTDLGGEEGTNYLITLGNSTFWISAHLTEGEELAYIVRSKLRSQLRSADSDRSV